MIVDMPDAEPRQAEVRTGKLSRLAAYGQDAGGERCDINGVYLHWVPLPPLRMLNFRSAKGTVPLGRSLAIPRFRVCRPLGTLPSPLLRSRANGP